MKRFNMLIRVLYFFKAKIGANCTHTTAKKRKKK